MGMYVVASSSQSYIGISLHVRASRSPYVGVQGRHPHRVATTAIILLVSRIVLIPFLQTRFGIRKLILHLRQETTDPLESVAV